VAVRFDGAGRDHSGIPELPAFLSDERFGHPLPLTIRVKTITNKVIVPLIKISFFINIYLLYYIIYSKKARLSTKKPVCVYAQADNIITIATA